MWCFPQPSVLVRETSPFQEEFPCLFTPAVQLREQMKMLAHLGECTDARVCFPFSVGFFIAISSKNVLWVFHKV